MQRLTTVFFGTVGLAFLTACAPPPEIQALIPAPLDDVDYPDLIPLNTLDLKEETDETEDTQAALEARVTGLNARAEALRTRPIE